MAEDIARLLNEKLDALTQILSQLVPPAPAHFDPDSADAFIWQQEDKSLHAVHKINRLSLDLLVGIDLVRDKLIDNTRQFALGYTANNVLLWGARGMGKSSLIKATHGLIIEELTKEKAANRLKLIEIHREDIDTLPDLMRLLQRSDHRYIIFCDDLSFDGDDASYKSLKSALEGGIEGRPDNVIFYATSNRRHLIPRDMMENERATAINPSEATEEKVSLSDRFGLWLGFHKCSQEDYLAMIDAYVARFEIKVHQAELHRDALAWATTRGNRSGRVAWHFIQDLAGRNGHQLL